MSVFVAIDFETADQGRDSACSVGLVRGAEQVASFQARRTEELDDLLDDDAVLHAHEADRAGGVAALVGGLKVDGDEDGHYFFAFARP